MLMVDVDDLKLLNDHGGHACGDRALEIAGSLLKTCTRGTDTIGRIGGDELAVMLPATGCEGAAVVVERILRLSDQLELTSADGRVWPVRVSIGAAVMGARTGQISTRSAEYFKNAAKELMASSDAALYRAKRSGKARASGPVAERWRDSGASEGHATENGFGVPLLDGRA